ncbi:MAG: ABC transporter ATP-binding protein [Chloroflexi bacterium]|nr:ABC transporter ATP-binding protein [Chloroflexota bacterium]
MRNLTVAYGARVALRDVSLSLPVGELLGLVGPNGSGKTTLIRAVSGVVAPQAGGVSLDGDDALRLSPKEVALRVAVVPQNPHLPPAFTALELVLMGRTPHLKLLQSEGQGDLRAARRAMLATDTWELAGRRIGELSGGERQRLLVARALAQETPLLLLDEPTAHLDVGHQAATLRLMARLCRSEGKAVLAAVHDLTLAAQFCHRLVMLHQGRVIAEGTPGEVLTRERLRQVYGASLHVLSHPVTGRPVLAPDGDAQ